MKPAVQALHDSTACYTQQHVVEHILDRLGWPDCGGRLLDPGAGDGAFLERAIARVTDRSGNAEQLAERVEGWEIHAGAAAAARTRIAALLESRRWSRAASARAADLVVIEADFLAPGPVARQYDVIAGNPPYLRFANLPDSFKQTYAQHVPAMARRDLLHAFLLRCAEVMADDARLACVTADRWLFNDSAAMLREEIGRRFGLRDVTRLEAGSAFYQAKTRTAGSPPRVHPVIVELVRAGDSARQLTRDPVFPDGDSVVPPGFVPLSQIAQIRLAPWLGPYGVFTVDAEGAGHLPADSLVPCVDTDDIADGRLLPATRFAIRTTRDVEPATAILLHLRANVDRLPARARRDLSRANWWLPAESWGPLPLDVDALLVARIARSLQPVRLPAGILPINHNLTVVSCGTRSLEELAAALSSAESQRWIERHAPRLENGYYSVATRLLRRLPVRVKT